MGKPEHYNPTLPTEDTNAVMARARDESEVVAADGKIAYYISRTAGFVIGDETETLTNKFPAWARTMWLSVQGRGASIASGDFVLRLDGYKGQAPYVRTFTLPGLQTLAVDVQDFVGNLQILACSFTGSAAALVCICVGFDPQQRPVDAISTAFSAVRYTGGAGGTAYPVPPGALEMMLVTAVPGGISWRVWRGFVIGAAGQFDFPAIGVLGSAQEVRGSHFLVPAGVTADIVWKIQL